MADAARRIPAALRATAAPGTASPDLAPLADTVTAMRTILADAVPAVAVPVAPAADPGATPAEAPANAPATGDAPAIAPPDSPDGARAMLEACERYFRIREPSSAALLLVTQARLLVGRPLMEAMEVLMPEEAPRAVISMGATGLRIAADRLRALSGDASLPEGGGAPPPETPPTIPPLASGADVAAALTAMETYCAIRERSSPVPLLLARARASIGKDFHALIADLIPPQQN